MTTNWGDPSIAEFHDIFSYSVKDKAMDVPPMEFNVDRALWETNLNRLDIYLHERDAYEDWVQKTTQIWRSWPYTRVLPNAFT